MTEAESLPCLEWRYWLNEFIISLIFLFLPDWVLIHAVSALLYGVFRPLILLIPSFYHRIWFAYPAVFDCETYPVLAVTVINFFSFFVLALHDHLRIVLGNLLLIFLAQHCLYTNWVKVDDSRHLMPYLENLVGDVSYLQL